MAKSLELQGQAQMSLTISTVDRQDFDSLGAEEALRVLKVDHRTGLTTAQWEHRLSHFGPNALAEKKINPFIQFLSFMWNPLSWVMEAAAIVALVLANGSTAGVGGPPDYQDFIGIVLLLLLNATIGYVEESQAGDAVAALKAALAPQAKVKRDGRYRVIDASGLVPGDIISIKLGDVIPADGKLLFGEELKIDQAALTGESLPVGKGEGDGVFSGSTVKQGEIEMVVVATGEHTFFGKAASLVESTEGSGHFQEILGKIGTFCIGCIALFLVITLVVQYAVLNYPYRVGISNVLTLLIGGIPIAMPTVLSVTLAIGATELSKKKAIVTRITAIEELAAMSMLCSDKTGTLTLNKLSVNKDAFQLYKEGVGVDECVLLAARASRVENPDAIDHCIVNSLGEQGASLAREGIEELHFMPFDPVGKRTQITYREGEGTKAIRVTKGAPHIVAAMCPNIDQKAVEADVDELAGRGFRALGLAICDVEVKKGAKVTGDKPASGEWTFLANIPIFDPPRRDTKETIETAMRMGVPVKMITGDALAIAKETGRQLNMGSNMYKTDLIFTKDGGLRTMLEGLPISKVIEEADGFAGVFPEHKYSIVQHLKEIGYVVGMTGDGVNDAPALKVANIGIAVADATDAARGAADLVLTEEGLSVIIDAIMQSRTIFQRMVNYSMYACATTVGIVVRFSVAVWAFRFNMPPFLILILAYLNDGTIMTISKDLVSPSPYPDKWDLRYIFTQGTIMGLWMAVSTLVMMYVINRTTLVHDAFDLRNSQRMFYAYDLAVDGKVDECLEAFQRHPQMQEPGLTCQDAALSQSTVTGHPIGVNDWIFHSVVYLQVSVLGQALIFVTRTRWFFWGQRPGLLLMCAFVLAQVIATLIAVYANWGFTQIGGCGWAWAAFVWVWDIIWFLPLDFVKIAVRWLFEAYRDENIRSLFFQTGVHGITALDVKRPMTSMPSTAPASTAAAVRANLRAQQSATFSKAGGMMADNFMTASLGLQGIGAEEPEEPPLGGNTSLPTSLGSLRE